MAINSSNITYRGIDISLLSETFKVRSRYNNNVYCLGTFWDSELIGGACLVQHNKDNFIIEHLIVLPLFRNNYIGSNLLSQLLILCKEKGGKHLCVKYNSEEHELEPLERFFRKNMWDTPILNGTYYRISKDSFYYKLSQKKILTNQSLVTNGYDTLYLSDLKRDEIEELKKEVSSMVPLHMNPLQHMDKIIFECGLFVKKDKKIIAWSIPEIESKTEIAIGLTYVEKEYRNSAPGLFLWNELYIRAKNLGILENIDWFSFVFDKNDKRLYRFYSILFSNILDKEIDYYIVEKKLE